MRNPQEQYSQIFMPLRKSHLQPSTKPPPPDTPETHPLSKVGVSGSGFYWLPVGPHIHNDRSLEAIFCLRLRKEGFVKAHRGLGVRV